MKVSYTNFLSKYKQGFHILLFIFVISNNQITNARISETIITPYLIASDVLGDYRSKISGNWNSASNWETFNGTNWINAVSAPNSSDGIITILNGHTITITSNITIDELVIDFGATLARTSSSVTLNDGAGDDMIINGTWKENFVSGGSIPAGDGTFLVNSGGIIEINQNPSGGETDFYANNENSVFAARVIWKSGAVFYWNTTSLFSSAGLTYFPNVSAAEIPIFRINCNCAFGGGATNPTIFNGIFEVQNTRSPLAQFAGTKTFRNGIRGAGELRQNTNAGPFIINGSVSELSIANLPLNAAAGLIINHSGTTTMNANVNVSGGKISLNAGDINLNGFNIDLGNTASIQEDLINNHLIQDNTATFESNMGGYIRATNRNVNATPLNIAGLGLVLSDNSPYMLTTLDRYHYRGGTAIKRIYHPTGSPTATTLRINYANDELAGMLKSDLSMFRYRLATGWVKYTTGQITDIVSNFVQVSDVDGFSNWTLSNDAQPLPIDLLEFYVEKKGLHTAKINWQTTNKQDYTKFEIEKSTDGERFFKIADVGSSSHQTSMKMYQFTDQYFQQSCYYRLKIIDNNAAFEYSKIVFVDYQNSDLGFEIYPNPVINSVQILNNLDKNINLNFHLFNSHGKQLYSFYGTIPQIQNQLNLIVSGLSKGAYLLKIYSGQQNQLIRFVKQ